MDQIIIGAGMTGLTLAHRLQAQNQTTLVLEKSRGLGGRMATRRDEKNTYDHGAQFYKTSRERALIPWHSAWTESGFSHLWFERDGKSFWCSHKGMTALAKNLASSVSVELNEKAVLIKKVDHKYQVIGESQKFWTADRLFLTCPLPQSLDLLDQSAIAFEPKLRDINYAKALVGLFQLSGSLDLDYQENVSDALFSISNQKSKGMSEDLCVTAVMQPDWAEKYFDFPDVEVLKLIENEFLKVVSKSVSIQKSQLKKWRFSHPKQTYEKKYYQVPGHQIYLAGDALGGPSLLGAVESALALSDAVLLKEN